MSKQKTKAELEELLNATQKENSELIKENNRLKNGGNETTYVFKFAITEASRQYLDELAKKTKFVSRQLIKNFGQSHNLTIHKEYREWPDGNRIIIYTGLPKMDSYELNEWINLMKERIASQFIRIEFYDVYKGIHQ